MKISRRNFCIAAASCVAWPAAARSLDFLADYEASSGGRIGLYVEDVASGRALAWRPDERFLLCSTFKASLAAMVLKRVDDGLERLDRPLRFTSADLEGHAPAARANLARGCMSVEAMCEAAVEVSDNTCANVLLRTVGGPAGLTGFWRGLGDAVTRLDHDEPILNRTPPGGVTDTTTAAAMTATLRRLAVGDALSAASRERFVDWLVRCRTGADRLRAGLPSGWRIGNKTGSNGNDAFADIAVAWPEAGRPILISAYTRGGNPSDALVADTFMRIGRTVASSFA